MKEKRKRKVFCPAYVDPACLARLDRIAEAYRKRLHGARFTRADACRAVIHVGLDAIERELGPGDTGATAKKKS